MANKTKSSSLPEGATRDVDAILAAYASGSIPTAAELKRVLASFSAWLPYLGRKLQQGPAPLRKAAISVLKDSGTRPGVEAIQAAARDSRMPAWLRSTAVEALAEGDRDPAVVSALAAQAAIAPGSDSLAAASPADRKARIQLLVEGAEGAGLPAIVSSRPELLAPIADAIVECETEGVGRLIAELLDVVSGKEQEKILRRAWHALRQKGIALPELKRGAVARPAAPTEATAYASYVDAEGSRMVLVMRARVHEAGGDLLQFILNDERGMLDYTRAWLPKRDLVPLVEEFQRREKGLRLAPIDPVWALKLARDAYQCSRRVKYEVPEEYVRERDGFEEGDADRPARSRHRGACGRAGVGDRLRRSRCDREARHLAGDRDLGSAAPGRDGRRRPPYRDRGRTDRDQRRAPRRPLAGGGRSRAPGDLRCRAPRAHGAPPRRDGELLPSPRDAGGVGALPRRERPPRGPRRRPGEEPGVAAPLGASRFRSRGSEEGAEEVGPRAAPERDRGRLLIPVRLRIIPSRQSAKS
ncbi:MAG: hypothetical protein U0166_12140 [Acidobacteriota bacterium]